MTVLNNYRSKLYTEKHRSKAELSYTTPSGTQGEIRGEYHVKSDDLTACLSVLLPQDKCAVEVLEGSSLPMRRDTGVVG